MAKKALIVLLSIMLSALSFVKSANFIYADDEDDEDEACVLGDDKNAYSKCLDKKREKLQEEIDAAQKDLTSAQALANQYGESIEVLNAQIGELEPQINELETKIEELEIKIEENEKKVEELKQRILRRMESAQSSMHFNPYLDFILGSNGFSDMLRRSYGVEAITSKEEADRNELIEILNQLEIDKEELVKDKEELDIKKADLEAKKQEAEVKQAFYFEVVAKTREIIEDLLNQQSKVIMKLDSIVYELDELFKWGRQDGFIHPVRNSSISASMPYYPASFGGGMHIGIDYAAGYGTNILAPADGVILSSVNACENDRGYNLGDRCGYVDGKGMAAGGNQIRMMFSVNGYVYGLIAFHMLYGSVHSEGVVKAGTTIGKVGSSGNSTGAHCHIELFYLGKGEASDIPKYLAKGYTVGFNVGYNLSSLCTEKGSAPCRLDGSDYFGYDDVYPYSFLIN